MSIKSKASEVRYLTHMIVFHDGDAMVEQKPFVHDLQFEAGNWQHTIFHHQDDARSLLAELITKGECRCYSTYKGEKITHVYTIEDKERPCGWFGAPLTT